MWISRVRVNGGFLAGLDVQLRPGLNVIVGPRGAGKTTLLELIRHGLGVPYADPSQAQRQQALISRLLGPGEVVLDLENGQSTRHLVVDAAGRGQSPDTAAEALAVGQNELESVASSPATRLNLVDLQAAVRAQAPDLSRAADLTRSIASWKYRRDQLSDDLKRRELLESDLAQLSRDEHDFLAGAAKEISERRDVLRQIENQVLQLSGQVDTAERARDVVLEVWHLQTQIATNLSELSNVDLGLAFASATNNAIPGLAQEAESLKAQYGALLQLLAAARENAGKRQNELRLEAEPVRAELEAAEAGLGQLTARIRNLEAELAQLAQVEKDFGDASVAFAAAASERDAILNEFEAWQESLYEARSQIARTVSDDLERSVTVNIQHLSDTTRFKQVLLDSLQGSGLQYRSIADQLSRSMLPRQLVSIVESNNIAALAQADLTPERAARVIASLASPDALAALTTTYLEDRVDFLLRIGGEQRPVEELSTGQKCAVTLPIVLTQQSRILVLDQPEDHLDNQYLVRNVVNALSSRGESGGQTIVATHNANIPVLGAAERVVVLDSNGVVGAVEVAGAFDEAPIVDVITRLMEGGREAFNRRAAFYGEYSK